MRILIQGLAATLFLSQTAFALTPEPAPEQSEPIALVGATVHVGNGDVIENGVVTFAAGKITGVGTAESVDTNGHRLEVVTGQHVYPGFVLPDSDLGLNEVSAVDDTIDTSETGAVNPNVRSLIAYNTDSEMTPTLRYNGVLTAQVSPNGGLVAGSSSIVQLDAWNWEDAAMVADDGIFVSWPAKKVGRFDFSTFTFNMVDNEQYQSQMDSLTALFEDATAYATDDDAPVNLKLAAVQGLMEGSQRLYVRTDVGADMVLAVQFAERFRIDHVVIIGGMGILDASDFLVEHEIPVIVTGVHNLPDRDHDDIDLPFRLPAMLVEAGLKVGLTYPSLMNARNLPFIAGTAVAYGLDREAALTMITQTNAEILGIDDQVGSLETGKNATLFVASGDALDMRTSKVGMAFIDGRRMIMDGTQQELYDRFERKYAAP